MKELLIMLHASLGVLGIIAAVWVIVETLNASLANEKRILMAALSSAILIGLSWVSGGFMYVKYYAADKAIILSGPWPFAHNFFMESKEHVFFITLILAFLLPIATRAGNLSTDRGTRIFVIAVASLIVFSGLAIEGAGGTITMGVKMGLLAHMPQ